MQWIIDFIKELYAAKYFGKVIISFESGKVVHVEKRVGIKPPQ